MSSAPTIPNWQLTLLSQLAAQGLLSGVNPLALAAIDQAESSGSGGSINSEGYGGYFGLGAGHSYPAGVSSAGLLEGTTPQAFTGQAEIAASEYASLLNTYGGNTRTAEIAYQEGGGAVSAGVTSSEGTRVFDALGVPLDASGASPAGTAVLTSSSGGVGGQIQQVTQGGIGGAVAGAVGGLVSGWAKDVLSIAITFVFVGASLGLILLGLTRMFPGVSRTVTTALPLLAAA